MRHRVSGKLASLARVRNYPAHLRAAHRAATHRLLNFAGSLKVDDACLLFVGQALRLPTLKRLSPRQAMRLPYNDNAVFAPRVRGHRKGINARTYVPRLQA